MHAFRRSWAALLLALGACERGRQPAVDTLAAKKAAADSAHTAQSSQNWDRSAGPVLLVPGETPSRAMVIAPDSGTSGTTLAALPHPASVTLFGRAGTVQTAELPALTDTSVCAAATLNAAPPPRPWSIGFIGGVVSPVAMDSTTSFGAADSAAAVVAVTRLASALPNDSAGRFTGLPFVVRSLWRFTVPDGPQVIAALLTRQINQEATPLQEQTLLIAERAPTDTAITTAYSERSFGDEETIENREVLGAVLLSRNPAVVVLHDFGTAISYSIVERDEKGTWRTIWSSTRRHC